MSIILMNSINQCSTFGLRVHCSILLSQLSVRISVDHWLQKSRSTGSVPSSYSQYLLHSCQSLSRSLLLVSRTLSGMPPVAKIVYFPEQSHVTEFITANLFTPCSQRFYNHSIFGSARSRSNALTCTIYLSIKNLNYTQPSLRHPPPTYQQRRYMFSLTQETGQNKTYINSLESHKVLCKTRSKVSLFTQSS